MKKIGRYIARGQLGRGGMSSVYKVEMPVTGKIAALKLLKPHSHLVSLMGMDTLCEMFIKEAVVMANLRHPYLASVWDVDESDGLPFYVMDYYCNNLGIMIGETFEVEKPSRIIPTEKAINYTRQILEGLACFHHHDIIHRDIKPFNILITDEDTVKICDFGLSKLRGEKFRGPSNLKIGSPWYAPPEQEKTPDRVDASSDLFAVGVMLYRMLTGTLPVAHSPKISRLNPDLDDEWDNFFEKAMNSAPAGRFRSAKKMLQEMEMLYSAWIEKQEHICSHFPLFTEPDAGLNPGAEIRRQCAKVLSKDARSFFHLDELWRPSQYVENRFRSNGDGTITDLSTDLMWEQGGSDYPLTWDQAHDYILQLNQASLAGRGDWRLPTIDELKTLLIPSPHGQALCIEPVFNETRKWLWSCDKKSHISAWYVSLDLGFVAWQDFTAFYYTRGVRNIKKSE